MMGALQQAGGEGLSMQHTAGKQMRGNIRLLLRLSKRLLEYSCTCTCNRPQRWLERRRSEGLRAQGAYVHPER